MNIKHRRINQLFNRSSQEQFLKLLNGLRYLNISMALVPERKNIDSNKLNLIVALSSLFNRDFLFRCYIDQEVKSLKQ